MWLRGRAPTAGRDSTTRGSCCWPPAAAAPCRRTPDGWGTRRKASGARTCAAPSLAAAGVRAPPPAWPERCRGRRVRPPHNGIRAHVIINDRSYSRIAPGGGTRTYPLAASAARRIRRPSGPVIRGPTEAAGVAIAIKGAQTDPGAVLLLHLDSQAAVRAVQDLPLGDLVAGPDAVRRFERAARQVGSARVIAAVTDGVTASRLEQALGTHLLDIVTIRPRGSFVSEAAAGSRLGGNPPGGAEAEAAEARQTLQRVREWPGPDYGS